MSTIDKQRIAAVSKLEQLGYTFAGDDWMHLTNNAAGAMLSCFASSIGGSLVRLISPAKEVPRC